MWETVVRWAIIIGIALFMWSVSASMEQIAKALTRLADAEEAKRRPAPPGDQLPTPPPGPPAA
jgi:hypothetical protein